MEVALREHPWNRKLQGRRAPSRSVTPRSVRVSNLCRGVRCEQCLANPASQVSSGDPALARMDCLGRGQRGLPQLRWSADTRRSVSR